MIASYKGCCVSSQNHEAVILAAFERLHTYRRTNGYILTDDMLYDIQKKRMEDEEYGDNLDVDSNYDSQEDEEDYYEDEDYMEIDLQKEVPHLKAAVKKAQERKELSNYR